MASQSSTKYLNEVIYLTTPGNRESPPEAKLQDTFPQQSKLALTLKQLQDSSSISSNYTNNVLGANIYTNPTPINIPSSGAGSPYPSTINVSGVIGTVQKVNVHLRNITHTYADDLDVLLVGPTGQRVLLMSDVGGDGGLNNATLSFDANVIPSLPDYGAISPGVYRPTNFGTGDTFNSPAPGGPYSTNLELFNNTNPNGTWKLYVMDDAGGDLGQIARGWQLDIQTSTPTFLNALPINIPDSGRGNPYPSTINVFGLSSTIGKITVTLNNLRHTYPDDLDLLLVGPGGQKVLLMSDVGGGYDVNGVNLTFDPNAAATLPDNAQINTGTYRPTNFGAGDVFPSPAPIGSYGTDLGVFRGTSPNGEWKLYALDDAGGDAGAIAGGWRLHILTQLPTFVNRTPINIPDRGSGNPYPSTINVSGLTGNISSVRVSLRSIYHTYPDDLDILLVGPTGRKVMLMSDVGGTYDLRNVDLTFNAYAGSSLPDNAQIRSGTYRPTNFDTTSDAFNAPAPAGPYSTNLEDFKYTNPNGDWKLYVMDDAGSDSGAIVSGWDLLLVTQSTYTNTSPINIPLAGRGSLYPSTINVSGLSGRVGQITVTLKNIRHTYPDDLDVLLVGPTGQKALLMSDAGGVNDLNGVNLTFSAFATVSLPDTAQIISGTYRPTDFVAGDSFVGPAPAGPYGTNLLNFNYTNPNGAWKLYVMDDAGGDFGQIAGGWQLDIITS